MLSQPQYNKRQVAPRGGGRCVRALTNSAGSVVNTYEYDAYGQRTSTTYNPFGYTGEYTDQESGLIYLRARYYDPSTQQFLTVDPLLASTEEAYAYVGESIRFHLSAGFRFVQMSAKLSKP